MNFLEDKFTFALTKYNKTIELILGVKFFWSTVSTIIIKKRKLVMSLLKVYYQKDTVELNLLYFVDSYR